MAAEDLDLFRVGTFSDADSHIKDKWYMVMLDLLPCICKKYTKVVRASEVLAAQITTGSDEALLLWWLALNSAKWTKLAQEKAVVNDQDHDEPTNEPPTKRTRKQTGAHDSRVGINLYYEICHRTSAARNDPKTGEEWDKALILEAKRRRDNDSKGHKGKTTTKVCQDTYVLCYSPGKEPHYERKAAPVPYEV